MRAYTYVQWNVLKCLPGHRMENQWWVALGVGSNSTTIQEPSSFR